MICCLVRDPSRAAIPGALEAIARACSPRVEPHGDDVVVFDANGLTRVLGPPPIIAEEVIRLAAERQLAVRVALAGTTTAAWLLAHACAGATVVEPGEEAAALAWLPIGSLAVLPEAGSLIATFHRWGIRTLGDLARLPRADVHARLGQAGVRLHQAAWGEEAAPLVPAGDAPRFIERLELEWPIEGLEPLSFVLARLCDTFSIDLERADRGAVTVTTRVRLVTRHVHERTLHLPAPMRDARVLRTLILLDLESHPPDAAMDVVEVELDVTPGRIVQGSLLTRALPSTEDLATLTARLGALMGESRIGAPALVDTHDERAVAMKRFSLAEGEREKGKGRRQQAEGLLPFQVRRYRLPIAARVTVEHGAPIRVVPAARGLTGGRVVMSAGPWRTSGRWWALDRSGWDRDEWDVELASGGIYRIARDRVTGRWEIDGLVD